MSSSTPPALVFQKAAQPQTQDDVNAFYMQLNARARYEDRVITTGGQHSVSRAVEIVAPCHGSTTAAIATVAAVGATSVGAQRVFARHKSATVLFSGESERVEVLAPKLAAVTATTAAAAVAVAPRGAPDREPHLSAQQQRQRINYGITPDNVGFALLRKVSIDNGLRHIHSRQTLPIHTNIRLCF